ncbi:MAG: hypothetical protein ACRD3D_14305 [Terriglobia bacterium]
MKHKAILLAVAYLIPSLVLAQRTIYLGALGGLATLSGDGRAAVASSAAATSLYDPTNGGAASLFFGVDVFNYLSFQASYVWNQNNVTLVSTLTGPGAPSFYRLPALVTQNAFLGNVLVYFRKRSSRIRPYLCEGGGVVHMRSRLEAGGLARGGLPLPPATSAHVSPALRTSVGLDVRLRRGWYFRYSFGETISRNQFGDQLSPPEHRIPKNFQSLFGIYRTF